jgi:drug/metabolite transporter (DMT)-like permease
MVERRTAVVHEERTVPRGASDTEPAPVFQLRQAEGYLFAMLSVSAFGTTPILIRAALADVGNMAVFGGFIAYTAALAALLITLVHPKRRGLITAMRPSTVRLFLGAGFFGFLAQMFRFVALP